MRRIRPPLSRGASGTRSDLRPGRQYLDLGRHHRRHRSGAGARRSRSRPRARLGGGAPARRLPQAAGRPGAVQRRRWPCSTAMPASSACMPGSPTILAATCRSGALADAAGMSERSFVRHYRQATGTTPARAVEQIRVEAARRRLELGWPVKRIASQLRLRVGGDNAPQLPAPSRRDAAGLSRAVFVRHGRGALIRRPIVLATRRCRQPSGRRVPESGWSCRSRPRDRRRIDGGGGWPG